MKRVQSREDRLRQNVTRLKNNNKKLKHRVKELEHAVAGLTGVVNELKGQLESKELERQQLLAILYKRNTEDGTKKPLGKKVGATAFHRPTPDPATITQTLTHTLKYCPHCQTKVGGVLNTRTRFEEDIRLQVKPIVKQHIITRHWCPKCKKLVEQTGTSSIRRIGLNTMGYILYTRYRQHQPIDKIQTALNDLYGLSLSVGEIVAQLKEAKGLFGPDYQRICELIKAADNIHADETGWRVIGKNWWLWIFVTPEGTTQFILEDTRGKGVARTALGDKEDRVITTDFYAGYSKLTGQKQRCWAHLLRDAETNSPPMYHDLSKLYQQMTKELVKPLKERESKSLEFQLNQIISATYPEKEATRLQKRLVKHRQEILTCLYYDNVAPDNNLAERTLRPQVIMRKVIGGCRSLEGANTHAVNASVLTTLVKPNTNFLEVILPLLQTRSLSQL